MTKHHLECALGAVRKANHLGRLYPVPSCPRERRALDWLVRNGVLVAQLGTATSAAGYVAISRTVEGRSEPVRKATARAQG
jgi:hypothetical protein